MLINNLEIQSIKNKTLIIMELILKIIHSINTLISVINKIILKIIILININTIK